MALAAAQRSYGVDARIATLTASDGSPRRRAKDLNIPLLDAKCRHPYDILTGLPAVRRWGQTGDILHAHLFPSQLYVSTLRKKSIVTTEHSTYYRRRRLTLFRLIDKYMYPRYRSIVCVSRSVRDSLKQSAASSKHLLKVIPNGVDIERFRTLAPVPREFIVPNLQPFSRLLVSVGRLVEAKNHLTQFKTLARLPQTYHLVVVGDGPLRFNLQQQVNGLGLKERVHFLGFRPDVPAILASADGLLITSLWEGFGLVAVEAMAAGVPVFATNIPGLTEVIGAAGTTFSSGDDNALAVSILDVIEDPLRRAQIIKLGKDRAPTYSIDKAARSYLALYEELVTSSGEVN